MEKLTFKQKKDALKSLSASLRPLVNNGTHKSINSALIAHYVVNHDLRYLRTYDDWVQRGFKPKRGQDYFLIWGRPKKIILDKDKGNLKEGDLMDFFPVCFMYSECQIEPINKEIA